MFINRKLGEISPKTVYWGPAQSGKTANLESVQRSIDPKFRSELVSIKTWQDCTVSFDFLRLELG
jgi:hypothetical protein